MAKDVLIVDDSAAIRKILHRVLLQTDIGIGEVIEAGDGLEALEKLKEHKVALILADLHMPNMDGLQFLSEVRNSENLKDLPVLIVSTEASQHKVLEAVNLGAAGYVRKPFTPEQIRQKLSGIL